MAKILLMIDETAVGGGQQHVLLLAKGLARLGHAVSVACPRTGFLAERLSELAIGHLPMELTKGFSWNNIREARNVVDIAQADVVHTHGGFAGVFGRLAAFQAKTPVVVHTYHGIHYLHFRNILRRQIYRRIDRSLISQTDATICVAKSDGELAVRSGVALKNRNHIIHNGVDVASISRRAGAARKKRRGKRKLLVGTIGRMHLQKGQAFFLEAASRILATRKDLEFWIVGDGELKETLHQQSHTLGIESNVKFLGERTDIPELLGNVDLFVLPSLWEGLPLVVLESMAAGCPIISTNVDGVSEIDDEKKALLLVPPGNSAALAAAIERTIHDHPLRERLVLEAFRIVKRRFDVRTMVKTTEALYVSLLQRRRIHGDR